jgi:hypothetical protein
VDSSLVVHGTDDSHRLAAGRRGSLAARKRASESPSRKGQRRSGLLRMLGLLERIDPVAAMVAYEPGAVDMVRLPDDAGPVLDRYAEPGNGRFVGWTSSPSISDLDGLKVHPTEQA